MNRRDAIKQTALLTGYALSASTITAVLQGCKADPSDDWMPAFMTKDESVLLAELTDLILPATETPGAKDVFVHRFIDRLANETFSEVRKQHFRDGLAAMDATANEKFGAAFVKCSKDQQMELLQQADEAAYATITANTKPQDPTKYSTQRASPIREETEVKDHFFTTLKGLTVLGYFTSEKIGEEVLSYDPIPGEYKGCIPLSDVGNSWSL